MKKTDKKQDVSKPIRVPVDTKQKIEAISKKTQWKQIVVIQNAIDLLYKQEFGEA